MTSEEFKGYADTTAKYVGIGVLAWVIIRVAKVFKGSDGKFSPTELGRFAGFCFFLWAGWYVITKEANRPSETQHIFSEMWLFLIFSGLLTVLHLDAVIDKFTKMLELLIKFRSKIPVTSSETTVIHTEKKEGTEP